MLRGYKEALRMWHEVVPNAQDHRDSFHLFATLVGYMLWFGATVNVRRTAILAAPTILKPVAGV